MGRMIDWKKKLRIFLEDFEHIDDVIGILVCGSYVTGSPTSHSDLDVHLLLEDNADFRERGNRVVDGLLIEYFSNPPRQILKYFEEDMKSKDLMCQTQFATGQILMDEMGEVSKLKTKALDMIDNFYAADNGGVMPHSAKYFLWDMLDDLQDAFENNRADFDFLYFNFLNNMISSYMWYAHRPYNFKTILGNVVSGEVRRKYLLKEMPDTHIGALIAGCIKAVDREEKMDMYQRLAHEILSKHGGFDVGKFKLKSDLQI